MVQTVFGGRGAIYVLLCMGRWEDNIRGQANSSEQLGRLYFSLYSDLCVVRNFQ